MSPAANPSSAHSGRSYGLRVSLAVNVLLGLAVVLLLRRDGTPAATSPTPATPPAAAAPAETRQPPAAAGLPSQSAGPEAMRSAIAELERMGFSRAVLGQAVIEDFTRRWDQHALEQEMKYGPGLMPEREAILLSRQREAEKIRALQEALGEEGYRAWDQERTLRFLNTGGLPLSVAEAGQAYRLQKEFEAKHRELEMAMEDGVADPADVQALQEQAQRKLDQELQALLGQERYERMRGSAADPLADIAWKFAHLGPTPEQANLILQAETAHRDREAALAKRLAENHGDATNLAAELKAINEAREANLRGIFGAEAYDEMQRQNDPTYKTLRQYAEAWELGDDDVRSVYASLHDFNDYAERTRAAAEMRAAAGQAVNWSEINAAIQQAQRQTELGLQNLLGAERLRRMKQNGLLTTVRPLR